VKGKDNTVAGALSRTDFLESSDAELNVTAPFNDNDDLHAVATLLSISDDSPFHAARCLACTCIRPEDDSLPVASAMQIEMDAAFLDTICAGYTTDP
jgi:hypothetical protein